MFDKIHAAFNNRPVRKILYKLRVPLALVAIWFIATHMQPGFFYYGLGVSFVGAFLQWWCFACLKKQKVLALNGPYAFVRNPMYIARYILLAGAILMTGNLWLLPAFTLLYYFYMVNRVGREEVKLTEIFGEEYTQYCREMPRFVPAAKAHPRGKALHWSWQTFRENHGFFNALGVFLAYAACWYLVFCHGR